MKSEDVAEFHRMAAPHSSLSSFRSVPGMPNMDQAGHIMTLITEEYTEITTALIVESDVPAAAKELVDLIYVAAQGLLALGLRPDEISEVWALVHESNMSKVDPARGLLAENGEKPYLDDVGKIVKPPDYESPDVASLIARFATSRERPDLVLESR